MAEKFSYWNDDDPLRKLAWNDEHFYDSDGEEHDFQPHHWERYQDVNYDGDPGEKYEITDFDPSDGTYLVSNGWTSHWAAPEELEHWDPDIHDPTHRLVKNYPIGSQWTYDGRPAQIVDHDPNDENYPLLAQWTDGYGDEQNDWIHPDDLEGPAHGFATPAQGGDWKDKFKDYPVGSKWMYNGHPYKVVVHDPHDPNNPLGVGPQDVDHYTNWAHFNDLKPFVPPINPRGFMPGDQINYMHPEHGPLPGQIEQPVHPFEEGNAVVNLDKDNKIPGQFSDMPLQYTVPHDQIKQQLKHDRGPVNQDAEIPSAFLHPNQKYPIGGQVYKGLSGIPLTVTDFKPSPQGGIYTVQDPDGNTSNLGAGHVSDTFTPDPNQKYWHGQPTYFAGKPVNVKGYDPYYDEYTIDHTAETPYHTLKGKYLAPTPDHIYEGQDFTPGQQLYFGGAPVTIKGYNPYEKSYTVNENHFNLDPSMLLHSADELYPGQKYKKGDLVYPWGSNDQHEVKWYNPLSGKYMLQGPQFEGEFHPQNFAPGPYTDEHTCKSCAGSGVQKTTCPTCGGDGVLHQEQNPQTDIFHTPQQSDICPECHGTGQVEHTCHQCDGTGNTWKNAQPEMEFPPAKAEKCPNCGGRGCPECNGKGWHIPPPAGAETCPGCHGTGERNGKKCEFCKGEGWQDPDMCPRCQGTGEMIDRYGHLSNCRYCHGSGERWLKPTTTKHWDPATGQTITVKQVEHSVLGGDHDTDELSEHGFHDPFGSGSYNYRRPTGYDPQTHTLYVGPTGAVHGDIFHNGFHVPIDEGEYVVDNPSGYAAQKGWHVGYIHHNKVNPGWDNEMGWYTSHNYDPNNPNNGAFGPPPNEDFLASLMGFGPQQEKPQIDTTQQVDSSGLDDLDLGF